MAQYGSFGATLKVVIPSPLKPSCNDLQLLKMDALDLGLKVEFVKVEGDDFLAPNPEQNKLDLDGASPAKKLKKSPKSGDERRQRKALQPGMRVGHWTPEEKKKYHWFLEIFHSHFENKQMRRMDKIFKTMADFLGSRAADQCRSHHQKMEKKYKHFYNIIFNLRSLHYGSPDTHDLTLQLTNYGLQAPSTLIPQPLLLQHLQQLDQHHQSTVIKSQPVLFEMESPKYYSQPNLYSDAHNHHHMDQPLQFLSGELSSEHLI